MDFLKSKRCFNWKVTGIVVGVAGVTLSIGCAAFFSIIFLMVGNLVDILIALSALILNLGVSVTWLVGIFKKKPGLLLVGLFWWAVPLSLWIGFQFFFLFKGVSDYFEHKSVRMSGHEIIYPMTVCFFAFYFAAVMSYNNLREAIRKNRSEIPRLDVSYVVAATECKKLNVRIDD